MKQIEKRMARLIAFSESLKGAKVYYREDWGTTYFDILGKQFGMMSPEVSEDAFITLKNTPEENEILREAYPEMVNPGYYANKKHWNSIKLAGTELTDEEIEALIKISYTLVCKNLTKSQKLELEQLD